MLRTFALATMMTLAALAARAEVVKIDIPDSTERLLVALPDGWTEAYSKSNGAQSIVEYLPEGQSLANWEEMITITTLRTAKKPEDGTAEQFAKLLITAFDTGFCKMKFDQPSIIKGPRNNFPVAVFHMNCFVKPEAKTASPDIHVRNFEVLGGIVIQGEDGIYQIQRAWHTDEFKINDEGRFTLRGEIVDQLVAANDTIHDFSVGAVTPCDTAKSDRPCTAPPITGQ